MKLFGFITIVLTCLTPLGPTYAQTNGSSSSPPPCADSCTTKTNAKGMLYCENCDCVASRNGACYLMSIRQPDGSFKNKCTCRNAKEGCAPYLLINGDGTGYYTQCAGNCPGNQKCELTTAMNDCACKSPQVSPPPTRSPGNRSPGTKSKTYSVRFP